jgi:uncharacterized small protein (DUF1192 family)
MPNNPSISACDFDPEQTDELSDLESHARSKRRIAFLEGELERLKGSRSKWKSLVHLFHL